MKIHIWKHYITSIMILYRSLITKQSSSAGGIDFTITRLNGHIFDSYYCFLKYIGGLQLDPNSLVFLVSELYNGRSTFFFFFFYNVVSPRSLPHWDYSLGCTAKRTPSKSRLGFEHRMWGAKSANPRLMPIHQLPACGLVHY